MGKSLFPAEGGRKNGFWDDFEWFWGDFRVILVVQKNGPKNISGHKIFLDIRGVVESGEDFVLQNRSRNICALMEGSIVFQYEMHFLVSHNLKIDINPECFSPTKIDFEARIPRVHLQSTHHLTSSIIILHNAPSAPILAPESPANKGIFIFWTHNILKSACYWFFSELILKTQISRGIGNCC